MKKAVLAACLIATTAFFFQPMRVEGDSMLPTYQPGDIVLTLPQWGAPKQGDAVVFLPPPLAQSPIQPDQPLIKRVAGLPGQAKIDAHTTESKLPGDGTAAGGPAVSPATHTQNWGLAQSPSTALPADHYYLIGDNPSSSIDSRQFGAVTRDRIHRRVVATLWSSSP